MVFGFGNDKPTKGKLARAKKIRQALNDEKQREREEREERIARRRSTANIQREARAKALNIKAREKEAENRLRKAKKASHTSGIARALGIGSKSRRKKSRW